MNKQGAEIVSWAGHVVDLWRLANFELKNPYSYSKFRQITALAKRSGATTFIEAGTYLGNTAMRCSKKFDQVITIELDTDLYEKSKQYLSRRKNVECLHGNALHLLPEVLDRSDVANALIFLDGHFSGGVTAHGEEPEPACEEIEIIARYKDTITSFIVDDFRCFGVDEGWPKKSDLIQSFEKHLGGYFDFTIHLDQLVAWRIK